jgi:Fur family transcriptional regulator, peroxide stress response regulator
MNYQTLLQQHNLKATAQRIAIMEHMDFYGHISIDELYKTIREKFASLSLATLYKNVHAMMSVNLIREVKLSGQKSKYEIDKEPHAHLMCKSCGELKDIEFNTTSLIEKSIKIEKYQADEVSIVISGICLKCQTTDVLL